MLFELADELIDALSRTGSAVLPRERIGTRRPGAPTDLPAVTITVAAERADELGFGRLVRGSEQLRDGVHAREDLRGDRCSGTVTLEAWAIGATQAGELARAVADRLRGGLREHGFATLRPAALDALESLRPDGAVTAFVAWHQRLTYRFVFEALEGGGLTDAGTIRRVDVTIADIEESFSAPTD